MIRMLQMLIALTMIVPSVAGAHDIDPTTMERARREVFPQAGSWKIFERAVTPALAATLKQETGVRLIGEEALTLEYQVAFSTDRPGRQGDVLGVMLIREVHTANGKTTIAMGLTVRGRIGMIVGVEGPDRRAIASEAASLQGKTLKDTLVTNHKKTAHALASEAHVVLLATKILLGRTPEPKTEAPPVEPPETPEPTTPLPSEEPAPAKEEPAPANDEPTSEEDDPPPVDEAPESEPPKP
jgi:hypothetical protein